MSTLPPPGPPPAPPLAPPPPPPPRGNTLLAVILGVLILLVLLVGFGVFVGTRILRHVVVVEHGQGANRQVDIHSPFGDLHVRGEGDQAQVNIQSPLGTLKVNPQPDLARLDMSIYPGATQVLPGQPSAFRGRVVDGVAIIEDHRHTGAEVELQGEGGALVVNVAEFRTADAPDKVLAYYQRRLSRFGSVQHDQHGPSQALRVDLSKNNLRVVAVRRAGDGTHFQLVRVEAADSAR